MLRFTLLKSDSAIYQTRAGYPVPELDDSDSYYHGSPN